MNGEIGKQGKGRADAVDAAGGERDQHVPVLVIDDDPAMRAGLRQWMRLGGFEPLEAFDAEGALAHVSARFPGCIVTDVLLPGMSGVELLRKVKEIDPELPVILLTGHGDVPMAVEAMREGAADFIEKPFDPDVLAAVVRRSTAHRRLVLENRALSRRLDDMDGLEARLLGECAEMRRLRAEISHYAATDASVMVVGETGTGKEVVARAVADLSPGREGMFVALNCAALPESMVEAELFGHEAGAFTGADRERMGRVEQADGGVLFLDEISAMPMALQPKLLRVLQEREVDRIGGQAPVPVDIRVVSAVNIEPREAVARNLLRQDLLYRLNTIELRIPPLRERGGDARLLFDSFANRFGADYRMDPPRLSADDADFIAAYPWPGNVRELRNAAERFVLASALESPSLRALVTGGEPGREAAAPGRLRDLVEDYERRVIADALARHEGRIIDVMRELDLPRRTLNEKMSRLGLSRP